MKKIALINLIAILGLLALIMDCGEPPTSTPKLSTTITGIVKDAETGKALQYAKICSDPTTEEVFTNAEGRYSLRVNVQVGLDYRIIATLNGYLQNHALITAVEGENRVGDIQLEPIKPKLDVSPRVLDFSTTQTSRIITIKNVGTGELNWAIKAPSESWLSLIGTLSGVITDHAQTVEVRIDRSNTTLGIHTASLAVTSNGGNCSIEVSMGVPNPNAPQLYAYPANLDFMNNLTQIILYIRNIGTGQLDWNLSTVDSWYQITPTSGTTTTETDEIILTAHRDQLTVDSYNGKITINSNGGSATINVNLIVDASPVLSVNVDQLDFGETETQKTFIISNIGGGTLNWTVKANQSWISLYPTSGSNQSTINVTVNRSGLPNGDYSGQIDITSNGGYDNILVLMKKRAANQPPVASFTVSPEKGDLETTFYVDASGSSDDYDSIDSLQVRWQWESGIAFKAWTKVKTASHKYTSYGNKTITLEIKDTKGATNSTSKVIQVIENKPPTASFKVAPTYGTTDSLFLVDATCSTDDHDELSQLQVRWQWEEGGNFTNWNIEKRTSHQYSFSGVKTITLEVKDTQGATGITTRTVYVSQKEVEPNNNQNQANTIQIDLTVNGDIGYGDDTEDWFQIVMKANGTFRFEIKNLNPVTVSNGRISRVYLYDSGLNQLTSAGDFYDRINPGEEISSGTVSVSGEATYYIKVPKYGNTHSAPYSLQSFFIETTMTDLGEPNNSREQAHAISVSSSITALIGYRNDSDDWYKVIMSANGTFSFKIKNLQITDVSNGRISRVYLYDSALNKLTSAGDFYDRINPGEEFSSGTIAVSGGTVYFIKVAKYGAIHSAPYRLENIFNR